MRIAILTRTAYRSPRILAESLQHQFTDAGVEAEILFDVSVLNRLVGYKDSKLSFHYWLTRVIASFFSDKKVLNRLKTFDAVIVSECSPNGFWKRLYNVERLKKIINKPVLFYEVYFLGNAPTQQTTLLNNNDPLLERYDGHLFVSPVTEIKQQDTTGMFCIGLLAKTWNLEPLPKKELIALVDFAQPGFELHRALQVKMLTLAGIPFISLERRYTITEIRDIYRKVSVFFMPSFEAFGLPILECLCTGAQIFTANAAWPMSWRLDENPGVHEKGILPGCFTVYDNEDDLLQKLLAFKKNYHPIQTPLRIFDDFIKHYPSFYAGDEGALKRALDYIKTLAGVLTN